MTDKERLKMIKHDLEERGQYGGFLDDCDTLWLIEQAEKVEHLQKEKEQLIFILGKSDTKLIKIRQILDA